MFSRSTVGLSYILFIALSISLLFEADRAFGCTSDGRYLMGTVLEITLCQQSEATPQQLARVTKDLFAATARLEAMISTFSLDSSVSFLNAHAGQGAYSVPPEVAALLRLSLQYWRMTQGTFDITVGPLMQIWGQAGQTQTIPSPTTLRQERARLGGDKITILSNKYVKLMHKGMTIDLGGIGKGYALDQLVDVLKNQKIANALLNFGQSSVWALGAPPDAPQWRLLVQRPTGQDVGVIALHNQALSISASFGQTFTIQGRRYGHVIDPRNGIPLQRDLLACVVAPTATEAEALSKALLILGEKDGIALLEQLPQIEGFLGEADGRQWMTTGWRFQKFKDT